MWGVGCSVLCWLWFLKLFGFCNGDVSTVWCGMLVHMENSKAEHMGVEPVFVLRVALEYTEGSSDKFYRIVALTHTGEVVVSYGRRGSVGNLCVYPCEGVEGVARKLWDLLRAKVGKGYRVAAVDIIPIVDVVRQIPSGDVDSIMRVWADETPMGLYNARPTVGKSARPAREGTKILVEMFTASPDVDTLFGVPFVGECEEFLQLLAYAHPGCPEDVLVLKGLLGA